MRAESTIVATNQLSELERVSHLVDAFGNTHGVAPKTIFEINVAIDEVLTNIISYAYPDGGDHEIIVHLSLTNGEFVVAVEDDGRPFNPLDLKLPDLDQSLAERPIGGLGIHLVRKVMDRLEYRREQDKNVFVMVKVVR